MLTFGVCQTFRLAVKSSALISFQCSRKSSNRAGRIRHTDHMPTAPAYRTARDLAREQITADILEAARRRVAQEGAVALSVRAVARDVGMASSAVYRYFSSRDELLTALIVAAYNDLGAAAEHADTDATAAGATPSARFTAVWHAIRSWALSHPQEYALIFGSPVPGYAAPADTIGPATRVPTVLLTILHELGGSDTDSAELPGVPGEVTRALAPMRTFAEESRFSDYILLRAITSWETLFGAISFELFGHTHNVVADDPSVRTAFFEAQIDVVLGTLR